MSLVSTPAVLLRSYAYSESSRILRFFTRDLGVVGAMARGIRKSGTALPTFTGGDLTLYVRQTRDLQTFKEFTPIHWRERLGSSVLRLGGASMAGELVLRHAGEEANAELFEALESALDHIDSAEEPAVLSAVLSEAWRLVAVLGYHPVLEGCVHCGTLLGSQETGRFDFPAGGVRCPACGADGAGPRVGPGARAQLRALVAGDAIGTLLRPRAHLQLLSDFVTYHVSGARPLESFQFLVRVLPEDDA